MTDRSTRATAPARRPRRAVRRTRQSLAVTMMVVGLVVGAFAAPSIAADGEAGGTVVEIAAAPAPEAAPAPAAPQTDEAPAAAAAVDPPFCDEDQDPLEDGCVPLPNPCDANPELPICDDGGEEPPPVVCDPVDADPSTPECDLPIDVPEDCPPGQVENGDGDCVTPPTDGGDGGDGETPPPPGGGNGGNNGGNGNGNGGGNGGNGGGGGSTGGGTTGGSTGNGSLGSTLGQAEGSVPGSETATTVTACSDSVICQAAPATTSSSSTTGLPETGAAENSRQLLVLGFGLLLAGGLLLKPGRRGRHRLVGAQA